MPVKTALLPRGILPTVWIVLQQQSLHQEREKKKEKKHCKSEIKTRYFLTLLCLKHNPMSHVFCTECSFFSSATKDQTFPLFFSRKLEYQSSNYVHVLVKIHESVHPFNDCHGNSVCKRFTGLKRHLDDSSSTVTNFHDRDQQAVWWVIMRNCFSASFCVYSNVWTYSYLSMIRNIPYRHFYYTCHVTFKWHVDEPTFSFHNVERQQVRTFNKSNTAARSVALQSPRASVLHVKGIGFKFSIIHNMQHLVNFQNKACWQTNIVVSYDLWFINIIRLSQLS